MSPRPRLIRRFTVYLSSPSCFCLSCCTYRHNSNQHVCHRCLALRRQSSSDGLSCCLNHRSSTNACPPRRCLARPWRSSLDDASGCSIHACLTTPGPSSHLLSWRMNHHNSMRGRRRPRWDAWSRPFSSSRTIRHHTRRMRSLMLSYRRWIASPVERTQLQRARSLVPAEGLGPVFVPCSSSFLLSEKLMPAPVNTPDACPNRLR